MWFTGNSFALTNSLKENSPSSSLSIKNPGVMKWLDKCNTSQEWAFPAPLHSFNTFHKKGFWTQEWMEWMIIKNFSNSPGPSQTEWNIGYGCNAISMNVFYQNPLSCLSTSQWTWLRSARCQKLWKALEYRSKLHSSVVVLQDVREADLPWLPVELGLSGYRWVSISGGP